MKKFLVTGFLLFSLAACSSSSSADGTTEEAPTVEEVEEATEEAAQEGEASGFINAGAVSAKLDEAAKASNGVTYTLVGVDYAETNGAEDMVPSEGNVFAYFTVVIDNTSEEVYSYTPDEFKLILPNTTIEDVKSDVAAGVEMALESGDLEVGESIEGVLSFEVPAEGALTLGVYGDHLLDEEPLVTWDIER